MYAICEGSVTDRNVEQPAVKGEGVGKRREGEKTKHV